MTVLRLKNYRYVPPDVIRSISIKALNEAIKIVGGIQELAEMIGCSRQIIYRFLHATKYGVSAIYVLRIEAATQGLVPRGQLRVDLYPNKNH